MRRCLTAMLAAGLLFAGCGATKTITVGIPPAAIRPAPETARTPDGAEPVVLRLRKPTLGLSPGGLQVSNIGVNLVGGFEGFSSCPYWDAYGRVWTRGYGETDFGGNFGGRCVTRSFGLYNLRRLLNTRYLPVVRQIGGHYNQCQVDAMASASYNLGPGVISANAAAFRRHSWPLYGYVRAGGVVLAGLVRRRREEGALFYSHRCGTPPSPEARAHKAKRLHDAQTRIRVLRRVLGSHGCRKALKHRHAGPRCTRWALEGQARHREVRQLHRQGTR